MTKRNKIIAVICWLAVVFVCAILNNHFHEEALFKSFKLVVLIAGAVLFVPIFFNSNNKKK